MSISTSSPSPASSLFRPEPCWPERRWDWHVELPVDEGEARGRLRSLKQLGTTTVVAFPDLGDDLDASHAALLRLAREPADAERPALRAFARVRGQGAPEGPLSPRLVAGKLKALRGTSGPPGASTRPDLSAFAGVKLTPHLDGLPAADTLSEIRDRRLPVMVHGGMALPPQWIRARLLPVTAGPVIISHLGSYPCADGLLKEAVAIAQAEPRVYLETAGTCIGNFLTYAAAKVPRKLLFGSASPHYDAAAQWLHVCAAVTDDDTLEALAWRNAAELLADDA
ncbi:MAG: amidohydrolase family protein [Opitutales bacterium]